METDIGKLTYLDKRIFYDPENRAGEVGLQNAISRGTPIVISVYCLCDLDEIRLKKLLEESQTKFVGLRDIPNMCGSRRFIEAYGKTWIEAILSDVQYAVLGGMNQEEYWEAWRKKKEIEKQMQDAENLGKAKIYQGLLEKLE